MNNGANLEIIKGINENLSLITFIDKYEEHINFADLTSEYSTINFFQYIYLKLKKDKEIFTKEHNDYEHEVFTRILSKNNELFIKSYPLIIEYDFSFFISLYENLSKNKKIDIEINKDIYFNVDKINKLEELGLIKNYDNFITNESNIDIIEHLLSKNKINIYQKQKNGTLGEELLIQLINHSPEADYFYNDNKPDIYFKDHKEKTINLLKKHNEKDKYLLSNFNIFNVLLSGKSSTKKELFEVIKPFLTIDRNYSDETCIEYFNDSLKYIDLNFHNSIFHMNVMLEIFKEKKHLILDMDLEKIYNDNYIPVVFQITKDNPSLGYKMIRPKIFENLNILSLEENSYIIPSLLYFRNEIQSDHELLKLIKQKTTFDRHSQNLIEFDHEHFLKLFEKDNFINLINFFTKQNKKEHLIEYLSKSNYDDLVLLEKNSPDLYKKVFINKNGLYHRNSEIKTLIERLYLKKEIPNQNIEVKQTKRL